MNMQIYTSGNLALSMNPQSNKELTVINGGKACINSINIDGSRTSRAVSSHGIFVFRFAVLAIACILVFVAAFNISSAISAPTYKMIEDVKLQSIRAKQGQSLWEIAETYDVEGVSTADMVSAIRDWNGLDSSLLQPGQTLLVADPS